jgi:hypothetical protein
LHETKASYDAEYDRTELNSYLPHPRADRFSSNGRDERMYAEQWLDRAYVTEMRWPGASDAGTCTWPQAAIENTLQWLAGFCSADAVSRKAATPFTNRGATHAIKLGSLSSRQAALEDVLARIIWAIAAHHTSFEMKEALMHA